MAYNSGGSHNHADKSWIEIGVILFYFFVVLPLNSADMK